MHNNIFITTEFKDFSNRFIQHDGHVIYSGHNPEHKFLFPLDDNNYKKFFNYVWKAYNEHEKYWLQEQQTSKYMKYTGIMIDLDAYQKGYERNVNGDFLSNVIEVFAKKIYAYINIPEDYKTQCFTLLNAKPYNTETEKYKEGIHLLFPGLKITREAKLAIFKECTNEVQEIFNNRGFLKEYTVLDPNSSLVPTQIYGTIRKNKTEAHKLTYVHNVVFSEKEIKITLDDSFMKVDHNLALELSIIYPGVSVSKNNFEVRETRNLEVKKFIYTYADYLISDEKKMREKCKELKIQHKDGFEVHHLLKVISKSRGKGGNFKEWSYICKCILGVDLHFLPFACRFSIDCDDESWKKGGYDKIKQMSEQIRDSFKSETTPEVLNVKALNCLRSVAKQDAPEGYKLVYKKTLRGKISNLISADKVITDTLIANLIHAFTSRKLYYINLTSQNSRDGYWYELIDEIQADKKEYGPFIHKYYKHVGTVPESLQKFVSETLHDTLQDIYKGAKKELENESLNKVEGEKKGKSKKTINLEHFLQKVESVAKKCGNSVGINSVINMCKTTHLFNALTFQLDLTPNIMGVGNGILEFLDGTVNFIQESSSDIKISRTTDTNYVAYDPQEPYIKKVEGILHDIIPCADKYEALLMHLSQVFVGGSAERYFNILYSGGSSGKSILMFLMENALGLISSCKFGAGSGFGYAESIDANVFTSDKKDTGGTDPQLINIEHARFVHCPEGKSGLIRPEIFKKLRDGASMRNLYEKNRSIVFKGIIVVPTNNQLRFMNYNYALERRFLYMYFPSRFVENPKASNEKKLDNSLGNAAKYDKKYGSAFLTILVHHWKLIYSKYEGRVEKALESSGIISETKNYLASQNYMLQYMNTKVDITKDPKDEIEIPTFCRNYAFWYKLKTGTVVEVSPDNFIAEVLDNFADHIIIRNNIQYLSGIRVRED